MEIDDKAVKESRDKALQANKTMLLAALASLGVVSVTVSYSGSGDSHDFMLDGIPYTKEQIVSAFACCHSVARAYAIACEDNGGDSSVDWNDIDNAANEAALALGVDEIQQLQDEAKVFNGVE